jgi:hypothetical protein
MSPTIPPLHPPPPKFDGQRFSVWLPKGLRSQDMTIRNLADRSGLDRTTIDLLLARGRSGPDGVGRFAGRHRPRAPSPAFNTIAAIAHGMELEFGYVASKAGVDPGGDRWMNFSAAERRVLRICLGAVVETGEALDARLEELVFHPERRE